MSTIVKIQRPLPALLLQNKVQNLLENHPGQFYASCKAGHKFPDTDELNILRAQARAKYPNLYAARNRRYRPTPPCWPVRISSLRPRSNKRSKNCSPRR